MHRVREVNSFLAIPPGLAAKGVDPARLDELTINNPVPMTAENPRALFEAALKRQHGLPARPPRTAGLQHVMRRTGPGGPERR